MTYMYPLHALCGTLGVLDNSLFVVLTAVAVFSLWNNNRTSCPRRKAYIIRIDNFWQFFF